MIIDFSKIPNNDDCFNKENNLDFLAKEHKDFFHIMMEIILIESASKISREKWQLNQLNHLIDYVKTNSEFWRQRIKKDKLSSLEELKEIPILERNDLKTQVDIEGCLLDHNQYVIVEHYSSGSSGVPIKFYNTEFNGKTNSIRSFAIRMANDFNLKDNTTILYASGGASYPGFSTWEDKREDKAGFLDTGIRRVISYNNQI